MQAEKSMDLGPNCRSNETVHHFSVHYCSQIKTEKLKQLTTGKSYIPEGRNSRRKM